MKNKAASFVKYFEIFYLFLLFIFINYLIIIFINSWFCY